MNCNISIQQITLEYDERAEVINARELHSTLEVRTGFSRWINRRIQGNHYTEDIDYWIADDEPTSITYLLTVDMAQELAILERNHLSHPVRDFLIEGRNNNLDYLQCQNYVQEIQVRSLEEGIKEIQVKHLKHLLSKYSEVQQLHKLDGLINFLAKYNTHYETATTSAVDLFGSNCTLQNAIILAEKLIGTEEEGWLPFD